MEDEKKVVEGQEKGTETQEQDQPVQAGHPKEVLEPVQETTEVSLAAVLQEIRECRKDTKATVDACKEIAKATGQISASVEKWRKAGKF